MDGQCVAEYVLLPVANETWIEDDMRIIQIGPYPQSPDFIRGGIEASIYGLAQEQGRTDEVHVFDVPRIGGEYGVSHDGRVTVHRFCNEGQWQISTSKQVKTMVSDICALRPDVCHIHGTGLFSWLIYRKLREESKVVVTIHGLVLVEKRNLLKQGFSWKRCFQCLYQGAVEKRFLYELPFAIVDTEYVRDMVDHYPIRKKPQMQVVPQGINESYFSMECSKDSNVLLSVGAIGERKGHLLTLEAFELLRQNGCDARLVIAGTVASRSYFERLKQAINRSRFKEDIQLLPDLAEKELQELYRAAHVFVLHTQEESQGIVFAEAMAMGLPVVSTKVGGVPFVVEDGLSGKLCDYGDVGAFASNMELLLTDSRLWLSMSEQALKTAQSYHWTRIKDQIMRVYH